MALFYLHRGSMGWGLKEFREIHVPKPPAFAPIHSFHGTTWPWSLSPCYSWKLLFVKNCIKSEKDKPKLERGYLQAISPTKDYASKYIKVYLPKETNWPNRNMDKRYEQTFTEEKDPIKIWKKMKLTRRQKYAHSEMLPCHTHQISDNNKELMSDDTTYCWGYRGIRMFIQYTLVQSHWRARWHHTEKIKVHIPRTQEIDSKVYTLDS